MPERLLHRPAAAARRDHAARRGAVGLDLRPPRAAATRCRAGARCSPTSSAERARDVQALRRLQAPHDAGRLRRLPARPAERERARARAAAGCRWRRGRRERRRERRARRGASATKAANRAAILAAARDVFAELGYEARRRARHRPPHRPRLRHVLQLLPRQGGGVPRRRRGGRRRRPARRVRAARRGARDARGRSSRRATARTSSSSSRTRRRSRSCAATSARSARCSASRARRSASPSWRRTCAALVRRGSCRRSTSTTRAHAMVAVGVELGARLAERDPPDVEGATALRAPRSSLRGHDTLTRCRPAASPPHRRSSLPTTSGSTPRPTGSRRERVRRVRGGRARVAARAAPASTAGTAPSARARERSRG